MKTYPYPDFTSIAEKFLQEDRQHFVFLPENLTESQEPSGFIYSESTTDIKKIFKQENTSIEYLTKDKPILRGRKSADWFGPTLFIGFSILSQNQTMVDVSLNLLSNYLYDFFKGTISNRTVKFDVIIETKKGKEFQRVNYEGSIEGVNELKKIIKELKK